MPSPNPLAVLGGSSIAYKTLPLSSRNPGKGRYPEAIAKPYIFNQEERW